MYRRWLGVLREKLTTEISGEAIRASRMEVTIKPNLN